MRLRDRNSQEKERRRTIITEIARRKKEYKMREYVRDLLTHKKDEIGMQRTRMKAIMMMIMIIPMVVIRVEEDKITINLG